MELCRQRKKITEILNYYLFGETVELKVISQHNEC